MISAKLDVTQEAHDLLKAYCKRWGMPMKTWLTAVILEKIVDPPPSAVLKKSRRHTVSVPADPDLWARPPFWEGASTSPEGEAMATCRACGAEIQWVFSQDSGIRMAAERRPEGNLVIVTDKEAGKKVAIVCIPGEGTHVSHGAVCSPRK